MLTFGCALVLAVGGANGYLLDDSTASDGAEGANCSYSSLWQRCPLQDEEAGMQRRRRDCEMLWFDETWAAFAGSAAVAEVQEKLRHSRFVLPHREQLPLLLNKLGLYGVAVEVGVNAGHFARTFIEAWPLGKRYHAIDPQHVREFGELSAWPWLAKQPKFIFHHGFDTSVIQHIPERSLDFVYIDAGHTCKSPEHHRSTAVAPPHAQQELA
jgi:hypothetical protein